MSMLGMMTKDPDERLDYDVDFSRWLTDTDELSTAVIETENTVAVADQTDVSRTAVKVWMAGGVSGETGKITVRVTTIQGRIKEACFRLKIKDC